MRNVMVVLLIALVAVVAPQIASAEVKKNDIGVLVGYIAPSSDSTISGITTEATSTVDYGLEYKHKFGDGNHISLGLSVLYAQFDVEAGGTKVSTIDNIPILVDLNWHFLENRSLYVGVTAGYAMWGDLEPSGGGSAVSVKQNVVYGANLGWDIPLGERWAILTNVRYLVQEVETDQSGATNSKFNVNPVVANVGFAFRF
jgi:outer membrane protein W